MGVGRFACVALPFALTTCSIICIMIAMLAGITNKNLYMFELDTANLSVSSSTLLNIADITHLPTDNSIGAQVGQAIAPNSHNYTADDFGLADHYKVNLWNYCTVTGSKQNCTKGKFDYAATSVDLDSMRAVVQRISNLPNGTLPSELKGSLKTFQKVHKWSQVVYIISILTGALTLLLGVLAIFSKGASCVTYIVSGIASTSLIIASIMASIESSVVVAAVKAVRDAYQVNARLNTSWIATTWLAVAFSLGAGMFWVFTICCCSTSSKSGKKSRRSRGDDTEKLVPTGAYHRVDDPNQKQGAFTHGAVPMKPMNRGNGAYEPYSHAAI
ncbi:SUR7/PalI family-domain-containing protein [Amylocarpus encephaloides]|uniref:SUR7/PalI family-domain-containing protein n=1 Tax=Amylocarpus encephaloides TaxID=45428 RepID=A0A9P8C9A0_9HELO|nr:SUR7/PalI family-domain-containing protein [Amylocarpus encephaloides]